MLTILRYRVSVALTAPMELVSAVAIPRLAPPQAIPSLLASPKVIAWSSSLDQLQASTPATVVYSTPQSVVQTAQLAPPSQFGSLIAYPHLDATSHPDSEWRSEHQEGEDRFFLGSNGSVLMTCVQNNDVFDIPGICSQFRSTE